MMRDKMLKMLTERAVRDRLSLEKLDAQNERHRDARRTEAMNKALESLARKTMLPGAEKLADAIKADDPSVPFRLERNNEQEIAKARGFLKRDEHGKWYYEKFPVNRDNRPAEKLVTGKTKPKGRSM